MGKGGVSECKKNGRGHFLSALKTETKYVIEMLVAFCHITRYEIAQESVFTFIAEKMSGSQREYEI
jgi:hypothetical protein